MFSPFLLSSATPPRINVQCAKQYRNNRPEYQITIRPQRRKTNDCAHSIHDSGHQCSLGIIAPQSRCNARNKQDERQQSSTTRRRISRICFHSIHYVRGARLEHDKDESDEGQNTDDGACQTKRHTDSRTARGGFRGSCSRNRVLVIAIAAGGTSKDSATHKVLRDFIATLLTNHVIVPFIFPFQKNTSV